MLNVHKKILKLSILFFVLSGCTYTDYPGHPGHKTSEEAFMPTLNLVIAGFGDTYDGTYIYSSEYDNNNWTEDDFESKIKIFSYRNVVTDSYPYRDGVYPTGEDLQHSTGFSGGHFERYWIATDTDPTANGGLDNLDRSQPLDKDGKWISPGMLLVLNKPVTEIDEADWDLQSTVKNASQLISTLVGSGGSLNNLELSVSAIESGGQVMNVDGFGLKVNISEFGLRGITITNQPATKSLINAILNNTQNMTITDLKLHFKNGMEIALPDHLSVMFNHDVLSTFVK